MTDADAIIESLENDPDNWTCTECTLLNQGAGVSIWIANGVTLESYGGNVPFKIRWREKKKVRMAFARWRNRNLIKKLKGESNE